MSVDREALAIALHALASADRGLVAAGELAMDPGVVGWLRAARMTLGLVARSGARVDEVLAVGEAAVAMAEGAQGG